MTESKKKESKKVERKYTKKQLINSKKYKSRIDLLTISLEENKLYTLNEVDNIIKKFYERKC